MSETQARQRQREIGRLLRARREALPCGVLPTTDQVAHIEGIIIDRIIHAGEPNV